MQRQKPQTRPMHRRPWLTEDDEELRAISASEDDARAIAARIGRSEEAVRNRLGRLGLRKPRPAPAPKEPWLVERR